MSSAETLIGVEDPTGAIRGIIKNLLYFLLGRRIQPLRALPEQEALRGVGIQGAYRSAVRPILRVGKHKARLIILPQGVTPVLMVNPVRPGIAGEWLLRLEALQQTAVTGGLDPLLQYRPGGVHVPQGLVGLSRLFIGLRPLGVELNGCGEGDDGLLIISFREIEHTQVILVLPGAAACAASAAGQQGDNQGQSQNGGEKPGVFHGFSLFPFLFEKQVFA